MMPRTAKQYLGDGVYVDFDGHALVLTTENGIRVENTIVLDPDVLCALVRYVTTFQPVRNKEARL